MPMLRQDERITLDELEASLKEVDSHAKSEDIATGKIELHLVDDNPHFTLGEDTVPVTASGLEAFAGYLKIPTPFLMNRIPSEIGGRTGDQARQDLINLFLEHNAAPALRVVYSADGVLEVNQPERRTIPPMALVSIARNVLGTGQAQITSLVNSVAEFAFDVAVPEDYDHGIGGDPQAKDVDPEVGDITCGGLSFFYNRKLNHTPTIGSYLYRLACTNGMQYRNPLDQVSVNGQTVDEVLAELNAAANSAFAQVDRHMKHFYDMRQHKVDNPDRWLIQVAREHSLAASSRENMESVILSSEVPDHPSEFDLINVLTNEANNPKLASKVISRRKLESVGGAMIAHEVLRCGSCKQKVSND
jgi:hypothetical protein